MCEKGGEEEEDGEARINVMRNSRFFYKKYPKSIKYFLRANVRLLDKTSSC